MFQRFRILLVFSCVFCMPAMIPEQESEYNSNSLIFGKKKRIGERSLKNTPFFFILRSTLAYTLTVSLFIVHDDGFVINVIKMFSQTWEKLSPLKSVWKWKWDCLFSFPLFFPHTSRVWHSKKENFRYIAWAKMKIRFLFLSALAPGWAFAHNPLFYLVLMYLPIPKI